MAKKDIEDEDPIISPDVNEVKETAPATTTPTPATDTPADIKEVKETTPAAAGYVPNVALSHLSLTGPGGVDQSKIPQNKVEFDKEKGLRVVSPKFGENFKLDATPKQAAEEDVEETAPQKTWAQLAEETIAERRRGQQEQDEAADKRMKWRKALSTISDVTGGIANLIAVGKGARNIERNDALDSYNKEYKEMIAARNKRREEDNLTRAEGVAKDFKEAKDLQVLAASRAYDQAMSLKKHEQAKELETLKQEYKLKGYNEQAAARMALEEYKQGEENARHEANIKAQNARYYAGEENKMNIAMLNAETDMSIADASTKVVNRGAKAVRNELTDKSHMDKYGKKSGSNSSNAGSKSANNSSNAGSKSGNDSNKKPRTGL